MPELTVKDFAKQINRPVKEVITEFLDAGLPEKSADDVISEKEKMQLIDRIFKDTGSSRTVVRRKTVEQKKIKNKVAGKSGTVSVEIRKKRTYIKKNVSPKKTQKEEGPVSEETNQKEQYLEAVDLPKKKADPSPVAKSAKAVKDKDKIIEKSQHEISAEQKKTENLSGPVPETPNDMSDRQAVDPGVAPVTEQNKADKKHHGERKELHITQDKRGKRKLNKRKAIRSKSVQASDKHKFEKPTKPVKREVEVYENITVKDLAQGMAIKGGELIKQIFNMGMMATPEQKLDQDMATLLVEEFGHTAKPVKASNIKDILIHKELVSEVLKPRAPVVTVMGHVDHGKTSLLDYIRKSQIVSDEQGGITQHMGSYRVDTGKGDITFLDTPGHEAFTAMRARGAKFTDIVVLVIAVDDGVMPQTEEAIQHAQAAKVPLVVALNKIDKPESDVEKVKSDLAQKNVVPEQWGGDTICIEVSAKTGAGIDDLLEAILLQAEVMELKAAEDGAMSGIVIESALDKGYGAVATILVQRGCLKKGDILLAGKEYGRVRMLFDENNQPLQYAKPSIPVLVLGLSGVPAVGEQAVVVQNERKAKEVVELRCRQDREVKFASQLHLTSAENFLSDTPEIKISVLNVLLKADVQGSMEALKDSLMALANEEVKIEIISTGIGAITESDISLASASSAVVIGFNVRVDARARKALRGIQDVPIRYYSIIYEVIDDMKQMLSGLLAPELKEEIIGIAEVKEIFRSSQFGAVAGCQVAEGVVKRGKPIRVLRDNVVIYEGELESLRRFKDEVSKVNSGVECGIAVKNYNDVKVGDSIEIYERTEVKRTFDG